MMTGMSGKQLVLVIVLVEAAIAATIFVVFASQGQPLLGSAIGLGVLVMPFLFIPLTVKGVASITRWNSLAQHYPQAAHAPSEFDRTTLSMSIRWPYLMVNNAILGTSDEDHLHLMFLPLLSFGTQPTSIPWAAITEIKPWQLGLMELTVLDGPSLWVPKELVQAEIELRKEMCESQ